MCDGVDWSLNGGPANVPNPVSQLRMIGAYRGYPLLHLSRQPAGNQEKQIDGSRRGICFYCRRTSLPSHQPPPIALDF